MTAAIGVSGAVILSILAASAQAQDPAAGAPDTGAVATQPARDSQGTTVGVQTPKVDPKLLIDVFKRLSRPRAPPKPPPPVSAPAPAPPAAGVVPAATPAAPAVVAPPAPAFVAPKPAAAPVAVRRAAPPRREPTAKKPVEPVAASPVAAAVPQPPSPPAAAPAEPADSALEPPIAISPEMPAPATAPAEQPAHFLAAGTLLLLIGLLAALAAIATATLNFSRARRIARTRAALALSPRLDIPMGGFSFGGLALAGPSVAIRARLDPPEARGG